MLGTLLSFVLFSLFYPPATILAQQNDQTLTTQGMKVSPAIIEVVVKPGQTVKKDFFVIHDSAMPLPVQIKSRPLDPIEKIIDMGKISTFNAAEWIMVSEPYHIFSDGETKKLTATITAPKDTEPGGHYAMISVEVLEAATTRTKSGASIAPRLGILAFITVPGPVERNLEVTNDRFLPLISADEIIRLNPDFKNTGTIHVMHNSKVHISNIFGSRQVEIPSRIILPNTIKEVEGVWRDVPLIGIYKAKLKGSYGPKMSPIESRDQYIVVLRWLPLLAIIIPLGVIGWVAYRTKGRWGDAIQAFKAVEKVVEDEVKEVEEKIEHALHHGKKKEKTAVKKKAEPAPKKKSNPPVKKPANAKQKESDQGTASVAAPKLPAKTKAPKKSSKKAVSRTKANKKKATAAPKKKAAKATPKKVGSSRKTAPEVKKKAKKSASKTRGKARSKSKKKSS